MQTGEEVIQIEMQTGEEVIAANRKEHAGIFCYQ